MLESTASPRLTTPRLSCAGGARGIWAAALQLPGAAWGTWPPPRRSAARKMQRGWAAALQQAPRPAGLQGQRVPPSQTEGAPGGAQRRSRQAPLLGRPVAALERCDRGPAGGGCRVVWTSSGWAGQSAVAIGGGATWAAAATAGLGS